MFPRWRNRIAPRTTEPISTSHTKVGPFRYHLVRYFCRPSVCAQTHIRSTLAPISAAVQPPPEPHPTRPRRNRSLVNVSLSDKSSVSASAYDDGSGEGTVSWQRRTSRVLDNPVSARVRRQKQRKPHQILNIETFRERGLIASRDFNFSLSKCLNGLTLPIPAKAILIRLRRRKSSPMKHERSAKLEVRHNSSQDAIAFSCDDSRRGHAKFSVVPRKKLAASLKLIKSTRSNQPPPKHENVEKGDSPSETSSTRPPSIRSDIEYEYKKKSYVLMTRMETSHRAAQLRIATNPLRITPRVQIPLCKYSKSCPQLTWVREPKGGVGEFQLGWKGIQISTDWAHPTLSIRRKTSSGGYSAISLNSKRVLKLDQNLVSRPIRGGTVLSLNSCMTNQKDMTGASISTTAPWGSISAHVRTSMACGLSLTTAVNRKERSFHLRIAMENLKTASFRLGVYY